VSTKPCIRGVLLAGTFELIAEFPGQLLLARTLRGGTASGLNLRKPVENIAARYNNQRSTIR
jgi:hypothetical protein